MLPTDLTVSAVVEVDNRFLLIEERSSGIVAVNQPGGHIEAGESPEEAIIHETLEKARCEILVSGLLGVYLWIQPQSRQQFLRIVYIADMLSEDHSRNLDHGIHAVHWYTMADILHHKNNLRSPVVLRCVEDYLAGCRQPESLLAGMAPVQQNVAAVMANACLV